MGQTMETILLAGDGRSATNHLAYDPAGKVFLASGTTIPVNGKKGYAIGCRFIKTNAANGQCAEWRNHGTATSCQFRPVGPVIGYGVAGALTGIASAGGDATEIITSTDSLWGSDITLTEHSAAGASPVTICAQLLAAGKITVTESADPSSDHVYNAITVRNGCVPGWDIFAAGTHTTAGGAAAEDITITGVLATDIAFATYSATDDTDSIRAVAAAAGKITVTCSADPSTTHGLHYVVLRPRGSFKPTHYIYAAGVHTTVGGAAAEAITVSGAQTTDIPIVHYNTTNDTDTIKKAVMTANTLTVTMTADPSTAHKLSYVILRAY